MKKYALDLCERFGHTYVLPTWECADDRSDVGGIWRARGLSDLLDRQLLEKQDSVLVVDSNDVDPLETPYTGSTLDLIHGQVHPFRRIE